MIEKILKELFLILRNEPLIKGNIEACITFIFDNFFLECGSSIESLSVSGEVVETMNFNDKMFE